jgi:RHS repeat-associated protein
VRTYTYDHANRLTQVVSGTLTTSFTYNGAGDRVAKTVDSVTTEYVLDPAAGLIQVLQETTAGQATNYLYGRDLLAQYDSGTWAYHVNDGLGSVRQLADPAGQVVQGCSFSPFGVPLGESGGEPYGFTGEQWDASAGLVYLRARYYEPGVGRFISKDPLSGFVTRPQSLNRWVYVKNNPVNRRDPSGLIGEPKIPDQSQWTTAGGISWEYSFSALELLVNFGKHVVAAAQRHGFAPQKICTASPVQNELMYTLAAIVYRESLGYAEEGHWQEWAAFFKINLAPIVKLVKPDMDPSQLEIIEEADYSIGMGQLRPETTARQIEEAGLLYDPGTVDNPSTTATPYQEPSFGDLVQFIGRDPQSASRVRRLADPVWAIEYAAANMDLARGQPAWFSNPQHPIGRPMTDWEKMAAWYNTGVINLEDVSERDREVFWKTRLEPYLVGTYAARQAIENLDLLGVKSECTEGCFKVPLF